MDPLPPPPPRSTLRAADAPNPAAAAAAARTEERRAVRPQKEKALHCPRCNSTNTKFCYYNNYSLQTPRYFCKTCRRYWTEGGSLRNVPVGGGCRKNKRCSSPAVPSAAASTSTAVSSGSGAVPVGLGAKNPKLMQEHDGVHELKLAFPVPHHRGLQPPELFPAFPSLESGGACNDPGATTVAGNRVFSAMELLRSTGGNCVVVPLQDVQLGTPTEYAAAGFALGEFRLRTPPPPSSLSSRSVLGWLSQDTHGTGDYYSTGWQGIHQENAVGRLPFPLEDLRPAVSTAGGANSGADQYEHGKDEEAKAPGHRRRHSCSDSMIGMEQQQTATVVTPALGKSAPSPPFCCGEERG